MLPLLKLGADVQHGGDDEVGSLESILIVIHA